MKFFAEKMWVAFAVQKLLTFVSAKNIRILYIESAKTVNEMTLNELVKLTTLWTTGPWSGSLVFVIHPFMPSCVSANPVSNTRFCYFLSVKMQNKKIKHRPSTKYLYFHKVTGPTLFWRKKKLVFRPFVAFLHINPLPKRESIWFSWEQIISG